MQLPNYTKKLDKVTHWPDLNSRHVRTVQITKSNTTLIVDKLESEVDLVFFIKNVLNLKQSEQDKLWLLISSLCDDYYENGVTNESLNNSDH